MTRLLVLVAVFLGLANLAWAQDRQCLATNPVSVGSCDTCSDSDDGFTGTFTFVVTKCVEADPEEDCEPCCFKATFIFGAGPLASIVYSDTFVQDGTSSPTTTSSPEQSVFEDIAVVCHSNSTTVCFKAQAVEKFDQSTVTKKRVR